MGGENRKGKEKKNMEKPKVEEGEPVVEEEKNDRLPSQAEAAKRREEELLDGGEKEGKEAEKAGGAEKPKTEKEEPLRIAKERQDKIDETFKDESAGEKKESEGGEKIESEEKTGTEEVEAEEKVEKEQTKEEILEAARGEFARADLTAEKWVEAQKKLGKNKTKEDFENTEGTAAQEYKRAKEKLKVAESESKKPETGSEEIAEVKEELEKMSVKEREKIGLKLRNLGFFVEEKKNTFFSNMFKGASKKFDKESIMGRWLGSFSESYSNDAENVRKQMKKIEKGEKKRLSNIGYLSGNILKYGRIVADFAGHTAASPLRYVMMGGMFFAKSAEVSKEARLKNKEVLEKTRVNDINEAAEEAWEIYNQAKEGKEKVSKEDLAKAYQQNLPKDLLKRLSKDPEPGTVSGILQRIIKFDTGRLVGQIGDKIEEIESNEKLSVDEKKIRKEKIFNKYSKYLQDFDGMVSQYGTVDALAMGAKYTQTAATTAVRAMMVETAGLAIQRLWDELPKVMSWAYGVIGGDAVVGTVPTGQAEVVLKGAEATPELGPEVALGAGFMEVAGKGDSVWKMAEDQLEKHYGERFSDLDPVQKTYAIDAIKNKIAADPGKFGLEDIDKLKVGQKVDFSSILNDEKSLSDIFDKSEELKQAALENIEKNNQILEDWAKENPGEKLLSEKMEEILAGKEAEIKGLTGQDVRLEGMVNLVTERLNFSPDEYNAIKDVKVGKLFEEISSKEEAWEVWRGGKGIDLPHDGIYGASEFNKHIKLAEFIRALGYGENIGETITIAEALEKIENSAGAMEKVGELPNAEEMIEKVPVEETIPEIKVAENMSGAETIPKEEVVTPEEPAEVKPEPVESAVEEKAAVEEAPVEKEITDKLLTEKDKEIVNLLSGDKGIDNTIEQLKTGKIKPNEFTDFYIHNLGASEVSPELSRNIKTNIENLKSSSGLEASRANRALTIMLQRILAK